MSALDTPLFHKLYMQRVPAFWCYKTALYVACHPGITNSVQSIDIFVEPNASPDKINSINPNIKEVLKCLMNTD